jgi:hypothetical protein
MNGQDGGKLYRIGSGSISCQGSQGCSYAKVIFLICLSSESVDRISTIEYGKQVVSDTVNLEYTHLHCI